MGMKVDQQPNRQDLYEHIDPLLYRLKNEIIVKNDLLGDIKLEYPEIFNRFGRLVKQRKKSISSMRFRKTRSAF